MLTVSSRSHAHHPNSRDSARQHCHQTSCNMLTTKPIRLIHIRTCQKSCHATSMKKEVISERSHASAHYQQIEPIWKHQAISKIFLTLIFCLNHFSLKKSFKDLCEHVCPTLDIIINWRFFLCLPVPQKSLWGLTLIINVEPISSGLLLGRFYNLK